MSAEFDPIEYINTPRWRNSSFGLERIQSMLEKLGRPQDSLRFVHVAGTNGKGSVCAYAASILQHAGYRTGLFTSPFIERFEERIQVNGQNIPIDDLTRITLLVRDAASAVEEELGEHPTEFELMCAVALLYFKDAECDIMVMEVGLGGRLDATNVITPEVSVITRIGLDHTALLGNTLTEIAIEKSGIIKQGIPAVVYPQEKEVMRVLEDVCGSKNSEITWPVFTELDAGAVDYIEGVRNFIYQGRHYVTRLLGSYQPKNAVVAIEAMHALRRKGWEISGSALFDGIANAVWPGRFEVLNKRPLLIVDGAHNPQGVKALAESISELLGSIGNGWPERSIHFVTGVLADKDYECMIAPLIPYARAFITYAPDNPRALSADDLKIAIEKQVSDGVEVSVSANAAEAIDMACSAAGESGIVVAYGSLYSIAEIKRCTA